MNRSCGFEGCTVDETGVCALERDPVVCSNRTTNDLAETALNNLQDDESIDSASNERLGAPVLNQAASTAAFPSSRALGIEDLNAMMATKYVNLVGILGDPESGKTACLASLYLLLSHAKLEGWSFADSKSLNAFDEIARGARDWNNGTAPEQMTVHTELADDHGPGFLHLRLVRDTDGRRVDFALPDIPGEWTQALVSSARSDRLEFLKSAEVIWLVLDGRSLADLERRHGVIARVGQLTGRLKTMLEGQDLRLIIVVTHHDLQPVDEIVATRLQKELARHGAEAKVVGVAPFSDQPDTVSPGYGIAQLISLTAGQQLERPTLWRCTEPVEGGRAYLNYRGQR